MAALSAGGGGPRGLRAARRRLPDMRGRLCVRVTAAKRQPATPVAGPATELPATQLPAVVAEQAALAAKTLVQLPDAQRQRPCRQPLAPGGSAVLPAAIHERCSLGVR